MRKIEKRELGVFVFFLTVGCIAGYLFYQLCMHLRLSVTPSAGARVFWIKDRCEFRRGEFAAVKPPPDDPFVPHPESVVLIKRFACMPGERIVVKGLEYYCLRRDGFKELVAVAKTKSRKGKKLTPWHPEGGDSLVIPDGFYFMANPDKDSYDSRYLGLISKDRIVYCVEPVL